MYDTKVRSRHGPLGHTAFHTLSQVVADAKQLRRLRVATQGLEHSGCIVDDPTQQSPPWHGFKLAQMPTELGVCREMKRPLTVPPDGLGCMQQMGTAFLLYPWA